MRGEGGGWVGAVGGICWPCSTVMVGKWTQNYSEVLSGILWRGEAQDEQPSGRRMGKLKVAVYGEGGLADSGNGLTRGKRSIQGPAFLLPTWPISSLHILLMEALAVPFQNKFH